MPSVTEIIFQLGEGKAIKGLTYHDTQPAGANQKVVVGGFFSPSTIEIEALDPDVIIVSSMHQEVRRYFSDRRIKQTKSSGTYRII